MQLPKPAADLLIQELGLVLMVLEYIIARPSNNLWAYFQYPEKLNSFSGQTDLSRGNKIKLTQCWESLLGLGHTQRTPQTLLLLFVRTR